MLSIINSMYLNGLNGYLVEVQTEVTNGFPKFEVVGLPDTSVKEAKERIKAAIRNSGCNIPTNRIIINLAPADTKKEGSIYDLPMAVGILTAMNAIKKENVKDTVILGELSLDGRINKINGILPMCIAAYDLGIKKVIIPKENEKEASVIQGIKIYGVKHLKEVINYCNEEEFLLTSKNDFKKIELNQNKFDFDFEDIKGQENAKRALEIASAGGHNCILIGNPGVRKNFNGKSNRINFT